jgi:predicted branched-subunit amino acid permease
MHPRARAQRLEMAIGILGFFTVVAFIVTVVAELRGQPALRPALVLACFAVVLAAVVYVRKRS